RAAGAACPEDRRADSRGGGERRDHGRCRRRSRQRHRRLCHRRRSGVPDRRRHPRRGRRSGGARQVGRQGRGGIEADLSSVLRFASIARARRSVSGARTCLARSRARRWTAARDCRVGGHPKVLIRLPKQRLDTVLVVRGLAPSRERARALILAGQVTVDGQVVSKAGAPIGDAARVELATPDHPYVGRGGVKLAGALDTFAIDPRGRRALDVGASTGGFTDVLLQRGAASVIALDVGRAQLDWRLRTDPRVLVREGVNARALTADDVPYRVSLVTIDVSFISLKHILPALPPFLD